MKQNFKTLPKKFLRILSLALILMLAVAPLTVAAAPAGNESQDETIQRRIIGYFCEWRDNELGQNYTVDKIPWGKVTHINYAFAAVSSGYEVVIMDEEAAIERVYPGQDPSLPYLGHFNLLNTFKSQYPGTKTMISIGGWAGSGNFFPMLDTAAGIDTFTDSCVDFIREYGFDGVDIDMEYPSATGQSGNPNDFALSEPRRGVIFNNYVSMMAALREKLDEAGEEDGKQYLLSIAAPASSWILGGMQLGQYAEYLDYVNMMTYDFHGAWNGYVGPQSAIYPDSRDPETTQLEMPVLNIDWAYRYFRGVLPPEKITVGVPYYSRGWVNVTKGSLPGGLYGRAAMTGGGADGIDGVWNDPLPEPPAGVNPVYHIKNLLADPALGYENFWDDVTKTSYVWNESKKVFFTWEDEASIQAKCQYIIDKGIGGYMTWELSGDFDYDAATGKYVSGDTLTTIAHDMFENAAPLTPYQGVQPTADEVADYNYEFTGNYDHPNYTYAFTITNNTGEAIPGGFTLEFDFPKSANLQTPWGAAIGSAEDNGDFTHYVLNMPAFTSIPAGGSYTLQGMAKLCFTGGFQNIQINGLYSSQEFPNAAQGSSKPVISGADDVEIEVGTTFDPLEGVTASDRDDGDLTADVTVTGTVDADTVGEYELTYSVTNSQDETTVAVRTVTVVDPEMVEYPIISGADDIEITVGAAFDPLDGVTAVGEDDIDLTDDIVVTGSVDTDTPGTYVLTYTVTDGNNTDSVERTVTVKQLLPPAWIAGDIYEAGDLVSHNGLVYEAKWWNQNNEPGTEEWGPWALIDF